MIEVIPFRGLLYNLDITGPLDKLCLLYTSDAADE